MTVQQASEKLKKAVEEVLSMSEDEWDQRIEDFFKVGRKRFEGRG